MRTEDPWHEKQLSFAKVRSRCPAAAISVRAGVPAWLDTFCKPAASFLCHRACERALTASVRSLAG